MKKTAIMLVAMCIGYAVAYGQAGAGSRGLGPIQASESAVRSAHGRSDGVAWFELATLYQDAARYDDAEKAFGKARDLLKTQDRQRYADALDREGVMYVERGRFAKAEGLEEKALKIRQEKNNAVAMGNSYMHVSLVAFGKHDLPAAEADAEMAVSLLAPEHATGAEAATPEEKMSALIDLALIRNARGGPDTAQQALERALQLARANYEANSVPVGFVTFLLGNMDAKGGDTRHGAELMKTGIEEMKTQIGWGHPTYVAALKAYRSVLMRTGRSDEASEVAKSIAKLEGSSSARNSGGITILGMNALR